MSSSIQAESVFALSNIYQFFENIESHRNEKNFNVFCDAFQFIDGFEPQGHIGSATTIDGCKAMLNEAYANYPNGVFKFVYGHGVNGYTPDPDALDAFF